LIDKESFKKYHVRIPRFRPEFVLDLRQKRSLTGAQLLHHIETADPFTKIWLPGKEIKLKYNLEITKPLFLQGKPGTNLFIHRRVLITALCYFNEVCFSIQTDDEEFKNVKSIGLIDLSNHTAVDMTDCMI
jgi:hypothetical protein